MGQKCFLWLIFLNFFFQELVFIGVKDTKFFLAVLRKFWDTKYHYKNPFGWQRCQLLVRNKYPSLPISDHVPPNKSSCKKENTIILPLCAFQARKNSHARFWVLFWKFLSFLPFFPPLIHFWWESLAIFWQKEQMAENFQEKTIFLIVISSD